MQFLKKKWLLFIMIILIAILFSYYQNNAVSTTKITIQSSKIPTSFNEYKIVQLSDLHSKEFGENQLRLVKKVKKLKPNLIVFTGDLVDADKYDEAISLALMKQLVSITSVYYVTGNHEWWSGKFDSLEKKLQDAGVEVLRNRNVTIHNGKGQIKLIGVDDPAIDREAPNEAIVDQEMQSALKGLDTSKSFTLLLSHRPELLSLYEKHQIDLVLSGHAHGGQVRIPFIGGLVAPDQGFLPKYTAGTYKKGDTTLIVNRGLGNSIIPQRLFNRPEIVEITLASEK
ncbi:metallophosphoesterase [Niallia sp. 01092]|uniref:metallophosphoesterase n=1 Tax=unclassified Niallia TaxID=2837522 RepID=UPI003FD41CED